jgi:hypothetical protein
MLVVHMLNQWVPQQVRYPLAGMLFLCLHSHYITCAHVMMDVGYLSFLDHLFLLLEAAAGMPGSTCVQLLSWDFR